ncbi:hypothetical protein [Priestia aryabhattai]
MENLRDLIVGISFEQEQSPFADLTREMNQFRRSANTTGSAMGSMGNEFVSSHRRMINESQAFNNQVNRQSDVIRKLARDMGTTATQLAHDWSDMSVEMRKSLISNHNDMLKYRQQIMKTEQDMYKLGNQMGKYTGTTNDFMSEVRKLGKEHKKATDQMINGNVAMRKSIVQTMATMSAMSGQSEKISGNYDRMGNALLSVNNPLLRITSGMEKLARESNATFLAFKMLGPNASMKALQDQIALINQGVMRMQSVALVTSVAWVGFTAILANAAKGPDVGENLAAQAQAWTDYKNAVQKRTQEIVDTWGLFQKAQIEKTSPQKLMSNLQGQVNIMKNWSKNINTLASRGVDEGFIASLRKMGPEAAGQVAALTKMSEGSLNKYVSLWREKHQLARTAATTELEKLKQETQLKVKDLQNSLTPLGISLYNFKKVWAEALGPFVEFWGQFAAKFVDIGTKVGEFVQRLNEISPWITKLAGMFLYLVATFALILTPLAAGIGYFMGLRAAFAAAWMLIGPLVTGLGAMMGTVLLVSAAVIAFGAALYLLWTRSETFRNAVISGWAAIKNKAVEVWGFLSPYINQTISAVTTFVHAKLVQLQAFWDNNGQQILQAVKNIWGAISPFISTVMNTIWSIMQFIWPLVLTLIQSVWGNIKGIINGALNVIMGAVKVFSGLFTGDFSKMWEGLKQMFLGAIQVVWNYVNLMMFGRILSAGKLFFTGFRGVFVNLWQGLISLFKASVTNVKSAVQNGFTAMKLLSRTIMNGLKDTVTGIWTSLYGGIKGVLGRIGASIRNAWTTARSETKALFGMIKDDVANTFKNIVQGAKDLPGKIGAGIKGMAGKVTGGIEALTSKVFGGFKKMINGATGGLNWIMKKIGADFYIDPWVPKYATGTPYHAGGPAILGDGGMKELYVTPSGAMGMSPAKDTLMNLPQGTMVFSGPQTQQLMSSGMVPAYEGGNIGSAFKSVASDLWQGTKNVAGTAKDKVVEGAGKAKDLSLDVWSYISEPSKLLKKVFASFVPKAPAISQVFDKIFPASLTKIKDNSLAFIKKKMEAFSFMGDGGPAPNIKGGAAAWRPMIIKAAAAMKEAITPAQVNGIIAQIQRESGGNQKIVQSSAVWDVNTAAGNPARGLLQYIPQTFNAYKVKGHGNIYSGYDQLLAFFNNKTWRRDLPYGRRGWGPRGGRKYKNGTNFHTGGNAILGDGFLNEPFMLPNGLMGISPNRATLFPNLPAGTKVWSSIPEFLKKTSSQVSSESVGTIDTSTSFPVNTSGTKQVNIEFKPVINIDGGSGADNKSVKQQIEEALAEQYKKFQQILIDTGLV